MSVCARACVCVYVCMHTTWMCTALRSVQTFVRTRKSRARECTNTHTHAQSHTRAHASDGHTRARAQTNARAHTHTHTQTHTQTLMLGMSVAMSAVVMRLTSRPMLLRKWMPGSRIVPVYVPKFSTTCTRGSEGVSAYVCVRVRVRVCVCMSLCVCVQEREKVCICLCKCCCGSGCRAPGSCPCTCQSSAQPGRIEGGVIINLALSVLMCMTEERIRGEGACARI